MTIAEHLVASRAAHTRYRELHDQSKNQDKAGMLAAVNEAQAQRQAAHEADPAHADPEWQLDAVAHDMLMQFYRSYR